MALKNFALRLPHLAEQIFITKNYKAHLADIEMKDSNRLELIRTILTNIEYQSLF